MPPVGTAGSSVRLTGVYDGWGYVHLYDRETLEDLGTYTIPEAQDPAYAKGYGDLSVHEVAADPDRDLAYFSYYAGASGLRSTAGPMASRRSVTT